ncbi:hypothetical protein L1987_00378 [Smallanthus sonchifolius]|uniref:Uncharacterized protein n=1 Tax=Smallanthus sonchifolius TaxID=185202 RepID=A0ACB9K272_9ASTR|nr:hypothetical protein L1987_00378 [Smallanthus sonchifolius]
MPSQLPSFLVVSAVANKQRVATVVAHELAHQWFGLCLDGLSESHPIEVEINHASEIDEIFYAISYRKGASVIRMLQSYLAPEVFQRALAKDIKKHACSNAKTEDLWTVLQEPVNKNIVKKCVR